MYSHILYLAPRRGAQTLSFCRAFSAQPELSFAKEPRPRWKRNRVEHHRIRVAPHSRPSNNRSSLANVT